MRKLTSVLTIRRVPPDTMAEIERQAGRLGLKKESFLRLWLIRHFRPSRGVGATNENHGGELQAGRHAQPGRKS